MPVPFRRRPKVRAESTASHLSGKANGSEPNGPAAEKRHRRKPLSRTTPPAERAGDHARGRDETCRDETCRDGDIGDVPDDGEGLLPDRLPGMNRMIPGGSAVM